MCWVCYWFPFSISCSVSINWSSANFRHRWLRQHPRPASITRLVRAVKAMTLVWFYLHNWLFLFTPVSVGIRTFTNLVASVLKTIRYPSLMLFTNQQVLLRHQPHSFGFDDDVRKYKVWSISADLSTRSARFRNWIEHHYALSDVRVLLQIRYETRC